MTFSIRGFPRGNSWSPVEVSELFKSYAQPSVLGRGGGGFWPPPFAKSREIVRATPMSSEEPNGSEEPPPVGNWNAGGEAGGEDFEENRSLSGKVEVEFPSADAPKSKGLFPPGN